MNDHVTPARPGGFPDHIPFGVLLLKSDGTVKEVSPTAKALLGQEVATAAELIGPSAFAGLLEERAAGYQELAALPEFSPGVRSVLAVWEKNGDDAGFVFLLSKSEFTNAAATREEILSTAAHDLKNPIGALFGYADSLLETKIGDGMSERQREILTRMRSTSARALELVRNYQQLADLAVGRRLGKDAHCDLNGITKTVLENTWCEDPAKFQLRTLLLPGALPVAIDKVQLDRAISNLLSNAYRYTPEGGKITITTERRDNRALFHIINNAPVIPPAELAQLFTPHFRASTSQGTSGTGLGLYIVRHIVEGAGGQVVVESTPETGTRFTLELPLAESEASRG